MVTNGGNRYDPRRIIELSAERDRGVSYAWELFRLGYQLGHQAARLDYATGHDLGHDVGLGADPEHAGFVAGVLDGHTAGAAARHALITELLDGKAAPCPAPTPTPGPPGPSKPPPAAATTPASSPPWSTTTQPAEYAATGYAASSPAGPNGDSPPPCGTATAPAGST